MKSESELGKIGSAKVGESVNSGLESGDNFPVNPVIGGPKLVTQRDKAAEAVNSHNHRPPHYRGQVRPLKGFHKPFRALKVLRFLEQYIAENGFAPSYREVRDECKLSSTSVVGWQIQQLAEHGYINKLWRASRAIKLLKSSDDLAFETGVLPINGPRKGQDVVY